MQFADLNDSLVIDDTIIPRPGRLLVTVKQASARYPFLTESAIRDYIYHAEPRFNAKGDLCGANGLGPGILRVPGTTKILIDIKFFDRWIESGRMMALPVM